MGITGQSRSSPWDLPPPLSWCHGVADPWGVLWYLRNALCHYRGYPEAQKGLTLPRSQSVQLDWSPRSAPGLALHQRLQALRATRQSQGRMGTPTLTISLLCTERNSFAGQKPSLAGSRVLPVCVGGGRRKNGSFGACELMTLGPEKPLSPLHPCLGQVAQGSAGASREASILRDKDMSSGAPA